MSRHYYVVCYDVRDATRLRRTYQTMRGYGDPLQYSVFLCELSPSERLVMEDSLRKVTKLSEDSVLIIDLGPVVGIARKRIRTMGQGKLPERERILVV